MNDNHGPDGKFTDGPSTSERYAQSKANKQTDTYKAAKQAGADLASARKTGDSDTILRARLAYEQAKVTHWHATSR